MVSVLKYPLWMAVRVFIAVTSNRRCVPATKSLRMLRSSM